MLFSGSEKTLLKKWTCRGVRVGLLDISNEVENVPFARTGTSEDVADSVAFLASGEAPVRPFMFATA